MLHPLGATIRLVVLIIKSLFLGKEADYSIPVSRQDAPMLWQMVDDIAGQIGVMPPDKIVTSLDTTGAIKLGGYAKGKGPTELRIGYYILATLSQMEIKSLIAHELAHALLSERGIENWLGKGLSRVSLLSAALQKSAAQPKKGEGKFYLAEVKFVLRITDFFGSKISRLIAAHSRGSELAADRISAELFGENTLKSMLIKARVTDYKGGEVSLYSLLLQMESGRGIVKWLTEKLTPSKEELPKLKRDALTDEHQNEYSSHPTYEERIAAVKDVKTENEVEADAPAIALLSDPESVATRLIENIRSTIHSKQDEDSQRIHKEIRKRARQNLNGGQFIGYIILVFSLLLTLLFLCLFLFSLPRFAYWNGIGFLMSSAISATGYFIVKISSTISHVRIPLPEYAEIRKTLTNIMRAYPNVNSIRAELISAVPAEVRSKRALGKYWEQTCLAALGELDYARALVASDICFKYRKQSVNAMLVHGIACGYFGRQDIAIKYIDKAFAKGKLSGSMPLGLAWGLMLVNQWNYAEGYLLEAVRQHPKEAKLWAILARCQRNLEKLGEAVKSVRKAVDIDQKSLVYKVQLAAYLMDAGSLKSAKEVIAELERTAPDNNDVILQSIRLDLLFGEPQEALATIESKLPTPNAATLHELAAYFAQSDQYELAEEYYNKALALEFLPEAYVSLADIKSYQKDFEKARQYLSGAINLTVKPAEDSTGALGILDRVLYMMRVQEEPVKCIAYQADLAVADLPDKRTHIDLLLAAPDFKAVCDIVQWLHESMHPGIETPPRVQWLLLKDEEQPTEPIAPGVYEFTLIQKAEAS